VIQKTKVPLLLLCLAICCLAETFTVQAAIRPIYSKVVGIVDGDTIEVIWEGKIRRLRIWGIDTPEWDQAYSKQSKEKTRALLLGRDVELFVKDVDKYGRLVAVVIANHVNISEELVRSGLAWVHIYYCREPICNDWKDLQRKAKKRHIGLWKDSNPIAPWVWKSMHKW